MSGLLIIMYLKRKLIIKFQQEHQLTLADLAVAYSAADVVQTPAFNVLASFRAPAAPTALAFAESVLILAAADGSLSILRLQLPTVPGSDPASGIQLREDDFQGDALLPWRPACHAAAAVAVDISAETHSVLSAGADGSALVTSLDDTGDQRMSIIKSAGVTFTRAQWATPSTFVTTSLQGVTHVWDIRNSSPVLKLVQPQLAPVLALQVHPAQHHSVATGDANGTVTLWDLRTSSNNVAAFSTPSPTASSSSITELVYDEDRLLCSTSKGMVGAIGGSSGNRIMSLYEEPGGTAAVEGLCVSRAGAASQVFASTDQEVLVYMANVDL